MITMTTTKQRHCQEQQQLLLLDGDHEIIVFKTENQKRNTRNNDELKYRLVG